MVDWVRKWTSTDNNPSLPDWSLGHQFEVRWILGRLPVVCGTGHDPMMPIVLSSRVAAPASIRDRP